MSCSYSFNQHMPAKSLLFYLVQCWVQDRKVIHVSKYTKTGCWGIARRQNTELRHNINNNLSNQFKLKFRHEGPDNQGKGDTVSQARVEQLWGPWHRKRLGVVVKSSLWDGALCDTETRTCSTPRKRNWPSHWAGPWGPWQELRNFIPWSRKHKRTSRK